MDWYMCSILNEPIRFDLVYISVDVHVGDITDNILYILLVGLF